MEKYRFTQEELGTFCRSLAHLIRAGFAAGDAIELMSQDESQSERKSILQEMANQLDDGARLSESISDKLFPPYVRTMLETGEETGRTEEALFALADYYDGRARLDRQVRVAIMQPLMLLGLLLVVLAVLLGWVLPVFDDVYRQMGSALTGVAGKLLAVGRIIRVGAPILIPLAIAISVLIFWVAGSERGRTRFLMMMRGTLSLADAARLTQILAMALNSGLDGERAMELAVDLDGENTDFRRKCEDCLARLQGEETLAQALGSSGLLNAADCRLLEAGFRSGCGDTVMTQLSARIHERSEAQIEAWLSRVEPAMVLFSSVLVGVILLSVLLPLTSIMASIG